jgi:hypothetical protein
MCVIDVSHSSMEIQAVTFFKEGVALGRTFFVVNSGGTSLIITITVEKHLDWGCYCDDFKNTLKKKYGKCQPSKSHTSMRVVDVPHS